MMQFRKLMVKGAFGLLLLSVMSEKASAQQVPLYSQYLFNMTNINPAYAGDTASAGVSLLYRSQWDIPGTGIKGAPKTFTATWLKKRQEDKNIGFGVQLYNDKIGIENSTGVQLMYSYRINFDRSAFTMGLSGGMLNYRANFANVLTIQPNDPAFMKNINGWLPTAGAGFLYEKEKWYASFSAPALLKTKLNSQGISVVSSSTRDNHYFLTAGYNVLIDSAVTLKPSVSIRAVTGAPVQFDFNMIAEFYNFASVGFSYRTGDEYVGILQMQLNKRITFGYAYDYITQLSHWSRSAHELMFKFRTFK